MNIESELKCLRSEQRWALLGFALLVGWGHLINWRIGRVEERANSRIEQLEQQVKALKP